MTDMDWATVAAELAEPFSADEIKQRPGRGRGTFSYVTARSVMERLDTVVGMANWRDEYVVLNEAGAVQCGLSLRVEGEWITKYDTGYPNNPDHPEDEALKSAFSDAFKRAAVKWGLGRHLYGDTPAPQARPATLPNGSGATPARTGTRSVPATPSAAPSPAPSSQPMPQAAAVPPAKAQPDKDGRYYCAAPDCGVVLASYEFEGRTVLPQTLADQSFKRFGLVLCLEHATAAKQGLAS